MGADLQKLINSRIALGLALAIGKVVPSAVGRPLARYLAGRLSRRRRSAIVRAVRVNQWVVTGERLSAAELDEAVQKTFAHTAQCLFNLYHNLTNDAAMRKLVAIDANTEEVLRQVQLKENPAVYAGLHISNFDFVMRAAAAHGLRILGIAVSESVADSGYAWQNELRRKVGYEIMTASLGAVREAVSRLEAGESVLTGMDRPLPDTKLWPEFFGRPAPLSVMHVRLAMQARVPVVVAAGIMEPDGSYHIHLSEPIAMKSYRDRKEAVKRNAEAVLEVAESYIRQVPQQWAMFFPVWPDVMDLVP